MHTFLLVPLSFLSGVFYPVDALPKAAQALMHFNPLFHVIDGFRYGMSGTGAGEPLTHVLVLVGVNLVLGWWAFRWFRSGYKLGQAQRRSSTPARGSAAGLVLQYLAEE